jgi:fructokinase
VRIGIDLGGTKIEAIALRDDGTECFRQRIESPRGDYAATIRAVTEIVRAVEGATGRRGTIGIGIPGSVSPATGLIKNANSTWLIGHRLPHDLEAALGQPVRLANDANCFALSEAADGAAAGAALVFGAILGTGVGGGIVSGGTVIVGANAVSGEWGHNGLPWPDAEEWPGPPCYCGRRGCIETFLSGSGLSEAYGAGAPAAREIAANALQGDTRASAAVDVYARRLAKALASVINLLDPDVIVLGGGLSNIEMLYERVPQLWSEWVFSDYIATRLVRAQHGDSSGVRGAAWLWT